MYNIFHYFIKEINREVYRMVTNKVKELVITAFFAAITFLGIQAFRIPLPGSDRHTLCTFWSCFRSDGCSSAER